MPMWLCVVKLTTFCLIQKKIFKKFLELFVHFRFASEALLFCYDFVTLCYKINTVKSAKSQIINLFFFVKWKNHLISSTYERRQWIFFIFFCMNVHVIIDFFISVCYYMFFWCVFNTNIYIFLVFGFFAC